MKRILSILAVLGALTFFGGTAEAGHCGGGGGYHSGGFGGFGFGPSFYGGRRSLHRHRSFSPYDFGHRRGLYHNHGRRSGIYLNFGF